MQDLPCKPILWNCPTPKKLCEALKEYERSNLQNGNLKKKNREIKICKQIVLKTEI